MVDYLGKVVVVDDDKNILRTFTKILSNKGYLVVSHDTGKKAIDDNDRYDVALVDYRLSDMEGTEVMASIKADFKKMITGSPSEEIERKAMKAGANAIYSKPVKIEILLSDIERDITNRKQ